MKNIISTVLIALAIGLAGSAFAGEDKFCAGFEEGYKMIKGDLVVVPVCPVAPVTPVDSTEFREGLKVGIKEASR